MAASVAGALEKNGPLILAYDVSNTGTDAKSWITRQGPDGIIYFGADSLLSYDGAKWRQSPINGAYAMRGLDFGRDGKLWAAANNEIGWYDQAPSGAWSYHSLLPNLPSEHAKVGESWHVFAEGEGALFVTSEKILRWDGTQFKVWSLPGGRHLEASRSGSTIYVHHSPTGLYVMNPDGPRLIIPASTLGRSMVLWVEQGPASFQIATSQGLFNFADDRLEPFAPAASEFIRNNRLTSVTRLPDGRLALGTERGGIAFVALDGSLAQVITTENGLPDNSVSSLYVDREKGLWVTSDFNIYRITLDSSSTFFNRFAGLQNQPIIKLARNRERIAVATVNSVSEIDPATGSFYPSGTTVTNVVDLHSTADGLLVAASGGIKEVRDEKTSVFFSTLQNAFAVTPSRTWPNKFLVSHGYSISLVDRSGESRVLVENLPDIVSSIAEDHRGRLWLGTSARSVLVAHPTVGHPVEAVSAGVEFGLPDGSGTARVSTTEEGAVLAFTPSGGWLLVHNKNRFVPIENFPGWPVNAVSQASQDGSVWIAHLGTEYRAASIARISVSGDRASWQPHSVDGIWNIGIPQCILSDLDSEGNTVLWIGGTQGLLRNVVAHGLQAPIPQPPVMRTLAKGATSETLRPITGPLPYSNRAILFEFAAPEFARRPVLRLETMLEGVDQHWVPADASSHRELTALREGNYTFLARTVAETGAASPATISQFEITPPWWRTGPAILGALLSLVPVGYGVYHWRVRRLRQRNSELEKKVQERTEQLEKASAAKTQFVANMSHDIRNPLNGIVGITLALEDTWLDVKQRELVSTLRECTTYLSTLVDDVLDFASIEAGQVDLRPAPFSPAELLRSIAAMFKMEAISSGSTFQVEADQRLTATYVGDAGRIQQILINFVSNALKYSGGPITLTATIPKDAPEEIEFSVSDQGPGISEQGQRLLFTKFSRLTDAQSKEITGTGLGLASCRLLAGLMSGSVGVRSSLGHGARFYLRLPLDIFPIPSTDEPSEPMAMPAMPNCSVLLVEDTNYNAMAAAAVLAKFGLTCDRACTGAEALAAFAEKRYNLVLLDRNLPDMDGTEVARRIREIESDGPRTIILAVTAYCTLEDRALCLNAGMDAFVGKPLTPQKLRRVLTAAGRRHLAAATMHIAPDASSTGVDVSLLEYISDGTNEGLSRQIELFLTALGEAEKQLDEAALSSDFKLLSEAAHGVLSHARLVGSASLSTAASALQTAAQAGDRDSFGNLLQRVRREISSLTATVRRHPAAERPA